MFQKTEYAVFRFLDKNGYCHMVSDYVKGESLAQFVVRKKRISKETFMCWVISILQQAEQYYKWENGGIYGWFMPYAVILAESGEILLLDPDDASNRESREIMEKKEVRAFFVKKEKILSQRRSSEDDAFGIGKTIQFMAAQCMVEPAFTWKEEKMLQRIIERCTGGRELTVVFLKEQKKELKKYARTQGNSRRKRIILGIGVLVLGLAAGGVKLLSGFTDSQKEESEKKTVSESLAVSEELVQRELELGVVYLFGLEQRNRGRTYLEKCCEKSELASCYLQLEEILFYGRKEWNGNTEQVLERGLELAGNYKNQTLFVLPFLKGYAQISGMQADRKIIELGEMLLKSEEEKSQEEKCELLEYVASAYEQLEEWQSAAEKYELLKEVVPDKESLGQVYERLITLYEKAGETDKMWESCAEAVQKIPECEQIWIQYVRLQLTYAEKNEDCVDRALEAQPQLNENEEFQKLLQEYGMEREGGTVE